jgi:hypothetical protein
MRESENKGEEERWVGEGEEGRRNGEKRAGEMRESYVSMVSRENSIYCIILRVAKGHKLSRIFPEFFHGRLSLAIWGMLLKFIKKVSL